MMSVTAKGQAPRKYFEDLEIGLIFWGDEVSVDRDEMLQFSERYDPQPMHLDANAAKHIGLREVIGCGAFTFALSSISMQSVVRQLAFLPGGLGFEMSFTKPVYAGDRLRLRVEVIALRPSKKPGRGFVRLDQSFLNQDDQPVLELQNTWVIATSPA